MKLKTEIDYLKLALSTDETGGALRHIYSDGNRLLACDGHRLHWYIPPTCPPKGFTDGFDGEYPDIDQVMPKGAPSKFTFTPTSIKTLGKLIPILDAAAPSRKRKRYSEYPTIVLTADAAKQQIDLSVTVEHENFSAAFTLGHTVPGVDFRIGICAKYLYDALLATRHSCTVEYHGELAGLIIRADDCHGALIMPQRLPKEQSEQTEAQTQ